MTERNAIFLEGTQEIDPYRERMMVALKATRCSIFEVDLTKQLYTFFENAEGIFGVSGEEILQDVQPFSKLPPEEYRQAVMQYFTHPEDAAVVIEAFESINSGRGTSYTARMRVRESDYVWCIVDVVPVVKDGQAIRMIGSIRDISGMNQQLGALEQRLNLDGFTGLWNKNYSIDTIRKTLEQERDGQHALLLLDIDHFKWFNDTYGHLEGDEILAATARNLAGAFRNEDIVGRFGGDEFIVLVRNVPSMEWVREQAERLTSVHCGEYRSTNSVGVARFPQDGTSFEQLFKQADHALYRAKEQRACVVFVGEV